MLNFFQYLNNLLFTKNKKQIGKNNCSEYLSSFILNRWASFYDKENCRIINENTNRQTLTEDPDLFSKYLMVFIPKKAYKKINYFSKNKDKYENIKEVLCKNLELGTRDLELIVKTTDKKDLKNLLNIFKGE